MSKPEAKDYKIGGWLVFFGQVLVLIVFVLTIMSIGLNTPSESSLDSIKEEHSNLNFEELEMVESMGGKFLLFEDQQQSVVCFVKEKT